MTPEDVKAASDTVRSAIAHVQGPLPPRFVIEFLLRHWRVYLALTHAAHGAESDRWHEASQLTESLLWSVAPKNSADERDRMFQTIRKILPALKRGMTEAYMAEAAQNIFLNELSQWHLSLLNKEAAAAAEAEPDGDTSQTGEVDLSDTITMDVRDPRYQQIMDLLETDNVEQIDF
ncbi:MAG: DUF1631 family protein [Gammaproteobacteria bacterium]|nr:DUF1631 family protein [Gammaproteobacteria bacterium]